MGKKSLWFYWWVVLMTWGSFAWAEEGVEEQSLKEVDGVYLLLDIEKPYTGLAFRVEEWGRVETNYKNGKRHGVKTVVLKNGKKRSEEVYNEGQLEKKTKWFHNGKKELRFLQKWNS